MTPCRASSFSSLTARCNGVARSRRFCRSTSVPSVSRRMERASGDGAEALSSARCQITVLPRKMPKDSRIMQRCARRREGKGPGQSRRVFEGLIRLSHAVTSFAAPFLNCIAATVELCVRSERQRTRVAESVLKVHVKLLAPAQYSLQHLCRVRLGRIDQPLICERGKRADEASACSASWRHRLGPRGDLSALGEAILPKF